MIPKIAHFHWEGRPLNWMRMMGLFTFARLNPRWEVRLLRSPPHIRQRELPCLANEADWTWLEAVHRHGGFAMATDTVFVNPVPDEWLEGEFCGCTNGGDNLYHCCFGATAGHAVLGECIERCDNMETAELDYQDMGITLLKDVIGKRGGVKKIKKMVEMPLDAMTPVRFHEPARCWEPGPLELPEGVVGVTWFGGHESNREWNPPADAAIVRLAEEVVRDT